MDRQLPEDFDPYGDKGGMRLTEQRDPWAKIAVAISIIVNLGSMAWFAGKIDQRQENTEGRVTKLEAKAEKDAEQDVKIAVISNQLATISSGVGEIKAKLERR
jgi:NhaP-type Na+/H+ and K+/H+ antiporter